MSPKINWLLLALALPAQPRLHHVHLNSTDPDRAISFYTAKFKAERRTYNGAAAVHANGVWLLFNKTATPPESAITSGIWHIGWGGGANMKETYQKQLGLGSRFQTPLTDLSDQCDGKGGNEKFLFAYVDGPDHALIELNTTPPDDYSFGHLHLLSEDPVTAGEWYMHHFGLTLRPGATLSREPRFRCGRPTGPAAPLVLGNISFIIYPVGNAKAAFPAAWKGRTAIDTSAGHAIDHFALSVPSISETLGRLRAAGVKILRENARSAMIEGPDRVLIELLEE